MAGRRARLRSGGAKIDGAAEAVPSGLRLRSWLDPSVVALTLVSLAAGFGQFGAITALGDVAKAFGHLSKGPTLADRAGLSATTLGLGLAILRLASLGSLFLTGFADRIGRRKVLLWTALLGLGITALAALSPSYWWFVVIFACGRPLLSTTSAVAQVGAAEETATRDRAKAIALIAAGYGVGSGLVAITHGFGEGTLGFRGLFALALVPLVLVAFVSRKITEPDRYLRAARERTTSAPILGAVGRSYRGRLFVVAGLAFFVSVVTGPANSFIFVYAQNLLGISGVVTSLMVAVAAIFGLVGLTIGRLLADCFGRRRTAALAMVGMALCAVLTYSGSRTALFAGYELAVFAGASFAPAAGALANELFPTEVRASVAGWNIAAGVVGAVVGLLIFGSVADVGQRFELGALVTFLPIVVTAPLFLLLPETMGRELEELWPDCD